MHPVGRAFRSATLLLVAISASSCTVLGPDDWAEERERLEDARRLWRSQGWDSYTFTLQRLCFCGGGTDPAEVRVRNGVRISVTDVATGEPIPSEYAEYYLTVEELFDFVEDAIDREAHEIVVSYDGRSGYPVSVRIDYLENAVDEEMAFEASDLQALR